MNFENLDDGNVLDMTSIKQAAKALVRRRRWLRRVLSQSSEKVGKRQLVDDGSSDFGADISDIGDFEFEVDSDASTIRAEDDNVEDDAFQGDGYGGGGASVGVGKSAVGSTGASSAHKRTSIFGFGSKAAKDTSDPSLHVRDAALLTIGRQIK